MFRVLDLASGAKLAAKGYAPTRAKWRAARCEVAALRALRHPRLPVLHASFDAAGWRWVVMELVGGASLRAHVERHGRLDVPTTIALGIELCEVLGHVASLGWTYRDLHPRNVHVGTPRGAVLLDLDGARPPGAPPRPSGRIGYRAPELALGPTVTPACDVYSLAGCLAFALTGDDPPAEPDALPGIEHWPQIAAVLRKCRRADPTGRPSVGALADALTGLL